MPNTQPAATLIVARNRESGPEVLLVKRHHRLSFAPGYWVFPGGKVESKDMHLAVAPEDKAKLAAVRETKEETALVIDPNNLVSTNHWTTPPGYGARFSTWFFVTHLISEQTVNVDEEEIVDAVWLSANAALKLYASDQLPMMTPTRSSLQEICGFDCCEHIVNWYRGRAIEYR